MKIKVLFVCKERVSSYGTSIGLVNSALFLSNFLIKKGIETKVVTVKDSNFIDKEVHSFKPTHVVIHALFVPPYKIKELTTKYKKINWQVRIHSKIAFLSNEGIAIEWLKEYDKIIDTNKNLQITTNSVQAKKSLNKVLIHKVEYLPNLYYPISFRINKKNSNDELHIGCFGAIRPMKNHLIQAMAAIAYADSCNKKLKFYVNSTRVEQKGESTLKNLKFLFEQSNHELIEVKWMNHSEFLKFVENMDLGLQVSLSETFNIVAADFVNCSVPIVVSDEIEWLSPLSKCSKEDINEIIGSIEFNLLNKKLVTFINKIMLIINNYKNGKIWMKYLSI